MLKTTFIELTSKFSHNRTLIDELWLELEIYYSHKKRHYHTLAHLTHVLEQLMPIKYKIQDWDALLFSLYYHDSIYNVLKHDNEEKSAELAFKRMQQLSVPIEIIESTNEYILATKSHELSSNADANYFTDADLSVLGQSWEVYSKYDQQVRKEYSIYPDIMYKPGRKKVLHHFLAMPRIYKTDYFYQLFELQAKQNLHKELELME